MVTKSTVARWGLASYVTAIYVDEMQDNYEKGNWYEAAKDTGWYVLAMTPLVAPEFFWGSVGFPIAVGVGVGLAATWIVLEVTGTGDAGDVWDLIVDPPVGDWGGEYYDVVAPPVKKKVTTKARQIEMLGSMAWHVAERQLRRTGYNLRYPYII